MSKKYHEKIVINCGGIVGKCQECKQVNGLRFVTETVNMCPLLQNSWQDVTTYRLCDRCADREKDLFENGGAEVIDGRPQELENEFVRSI